MNAPIINNLAHIYGKPSPEEVEYWATWLKENNGSKPQGWEKPVHASQYPEVLTAQAAILALRERKIQSINQQIQQPQHFVNPILEKIDQERKRSAEMMGINSIYARCSYSAPETKETQVIQFFRQNMMAEKRQSAVILGGTGSGKTYGAVCYLSQFGGFYCTAYDLTDYIIDKARSTLDMVEKIPYLLLDDLGTEPDLDGYRGKEFIAYFQNLITKRHNSNRVTIITANFTKGDFTARYGDRVISRLKDCALIFETKDPDLRTIPQY